MKAFTITLTQDQLNILSAAIGEIPTKLGLGLANAINSQITEQQHAEQAAPGRPALSVVDDKAASPSSARI